MNGQSAIGPGVFGGGMYGGQFEGRLAQLSLVAANTPGRPTTGNHVHGEIYMDAQATLFVCVTGGNPGTWRRILTGFA